MANSLRTEHLFKELNSALFHIDSGYTYSDVVEKLQELALSVKDETQPDWYLGDCSLDTLLIGAYWFFTEFHGGQESPEYAALSTISTIYNPGSTSGPEPSSTEADVYEALEVMFNARNSVVTKESFIEMTGQEPLYDDLDRCNCPKAGLPGHKACGICEHNIPIFRCEVCFQQRFSEDI